MTLATLARKHTRPVGNLSPCVRTVALAVRARITYFGAAAVFLDAQWNVHAVKPGPQAEAMIGDGRGFVGTYVLCGHGLTSRIELDLRQTALELRA